MTTISHKLFKWSGRVAGAILALGLVVLGILLGLARSPLDDVQADVEATQRGIARAASHE